MDKDMKKTNRKQYVWSKLATDLYGSSVSIKKSTSIEFEGVRGIIEDETANLLKVRTEAKSIWVPKDNQIFEIELEDGSKVIVEGRIIKGKPENRVKKKFRNW
ncbi:MAG: ribonuclease P protein subunit [Candidatus Heimdallarchaeota archaeon]|nr:ribonuclease P protein subunit [Candidatus Heimdallarchaeota archaeon]MCK4955569.1 ribonuclease P protein subunit [Candidatus Heimdallarchaeota archaeon]